MGSPKTSPSSSTPGWFKRLRRWRSFHWSWKLSFSHSWRWIRLSLGFSLIDDVAFRVISVLEAVVLLASISCFFLCCGCQMEMVNNSGGFPRPILPGATRVGWIGVGVMGAAMAGRILAAGYSLTVYARTTSKAAGLISAGARLADSPSAVAAVSDVVFTMVGHPSDVRTAVLDPATGALSALPSGSVLVDHTSSHPVLAREIAAAARSRGCWAIDAPVSGGDVGAREGKLAIFAGGEDGVIQWLAPIWEILGRATAMGGPGSGQSSKIANQIAVGGSLLGLSEALVFAGAAGLDAGEFLSAVRGGAAGSAAIEIWGERVIERDFLPGGFVEYMVKDLGMGLEDGGGDEGAPAMLLPGAALCRQLYQAMVANGDGKMGTQGLITVIERINGK